MPSNPPKNSEPIADGRVMPAGQRTGAPGLMLALGGDRGGKDNFAFTQREGSA